SRTCSRGSPTRNCQTAVRSRCRRVRIAAPTTIRSRSPAGGSSNRFTAEGGAAMKRLVLVVAAAAAILSADRTSVGAGSPATPAELDKLLAPVALYPDQLLAQMLLCSANPGKIAALNEWLRSHETLKGTELQTAAASSGFEDSYVALVLFPSVIEYMAVQADWTAALGKAFAADKSAVFASIQRLRAKAKAAGTLKSTPQQQVETKTTSAGQQVIVIEPTNPQIVYVPQYNPEVVYVQAPTTTVVVQENNTDVAVAAGLIGFTAGIAIGAAVNNNYYYGPYGWHGGAYMYNDAWDDYYDHREDAREDWQDNREDLAEERTDRAENRSEQRTDRAGTTQEQRTDRQQTRQENRPESTTQAQRTERSTQAQGAATQSATSQAKGSGRTGSAEARGYGDGSKSQAAPKRNSGGSDAFSGYSSGKSTRSSSARGQQSRGSSRGGGGGRRR